MNRSRLIALAVVAAIVIAGAFTHGFGLLKGGDKELKLYGNVDVRTVDLAFRVAGRIDRIAVDEGQSVKRGDLLAALDTQSLDARIGEANAQVEQARAQYTKTRAGNRQQEIAQARARTTAAAATAHTAEQDYNRRSALVASGAISRDLWERTVADRTRAEAQLREAQQAQSLQLAGARPEDVAAARAQVSAAEAARRSAATDLSDTRLTAPEDAIVDTRAREPGAIVQPGETVLTLAIPRPLRVRAYIAEPDLPRINPGMRVTVTADGATRPYKGVISWIAPKAEFTPKSVETESLRTDLVYRVRITVSDPDNQLRQGQPVTVTVPGARLKR